MTSLFEKFMAAHRAQCEFVAGLPEDAAAAAERFGAAIAEFTASAGPTGKAPKKARAPKAEKKERANTGQPICWATFCKVKREENKGAYDAWLAQRLEAARTGKLFYAATDPAVKDGRATAGDAISEKKAKQAAHIVWVSLQYRGEDQSEWKAFEAAWKETHPKGSPAASVADDASDAGSAEGSDSAAEKPKAKRGPKKMADMTPEELAAAKAKRAAAKAVKDAAKAASEAVERASSCMEPAIPSAAVGGGGAPAAMPSAPEEPELSLLPFHHRKVDYLRLGYTDAEGETVWDEPGDLWMADKTYAGILLASGKIDSRPEVMAAAPDLEE